MKWFPDDWRIRITGAVGGGLGMTVPMILGQELKLKGLLPGGIAIIIGITIGTLLGQFVGRLLFQPSPASPPDNPPRN